MILACGAVLHYASERGAEGADRASRAIYEAVLKATATGVRTHDLGGHAGTTEFTDDVIGRVRTKIDVWSSAGLHRLRTEAPFPAVCGNVDWCKIPCRTRVPVRPPA